MAKSKNILLISMCRPCDIMIEAEIKNPKMAPYGCLSMASYIHAYSKTKSKVAVLDLLSSNFNEKQCLDMIIKTLSQKSYDIIGFSLLFNNTQAYLPFLCKEIKKTYPNIKTLAGGQVGSNFYSELLNDIPELDAICVFEGEIPMLDLADSEDIDKCLEEHQSFVTRDSLVNGKKIIPLFVDDLDSIPFIDYSLIDMNDYPFTSDVPSEVGDITLTGFERDLWIHTSRGCPFGCVFCAAHSVHGKKVRYMSAQRVIDSAKDMIDRFGMTQLSIMDDQFLLDAKRARDILRGLVELGTLTITLATISVGLIDEEMAIYLKQLKCLRVSVAIESGSQYVLDKVMHKPVNLDKARQTVAMLKKQGLYVTSNFVIGVPGETDEHRQETLEFIRSTQLDWCLFFDATPLKGSELYEICEREGYLVDDPMKSDMWSSIITTPEYTAEHISKQAYLMNLSANFINNNNWRNGRKDMAQKKFLHVAKNYPDHAVAHYCLARGYRDFKNGGGMKSIYKYSVKYLKAAKHGGNIVIGWV